MWYQHKISAHTVLYNRVPLAYTITVSHDQTKMTLCNLCTRRWKASPVNLPSFFLARQWCDIEQKIGTTLVPPPLVTEGVNLAKKVFFSFLSECFHPSEDRRKELPNDCMTESVGNGEQSSESKKKGIEPPKSPPSNDIAKNNSGVGWCDLRVRYSTEKQHPFNGQIAWRRQ